MGWGRCMRVCMVQILMQLSTKDLNECMVSQINYYYCGHACRWEWYYLQAGNSFGALL